MASTSAPASPTLVARLIAEAIGTFFLVVAVIGTALFTSSFTGPLGVALAIGLVVLVGAYAFGPISGGHFNPAVTLGVAAAGRLPWRDVLPYIGAQLVGGIAGSSLLALIAAGGQERFVDGLVKSGFASNGFGEHSQLGFSLWAVILTEVVLTALFVYVILSVTHLRAAAGFAPIAIGLTLTIIHLVAIPISNASVNPARSIATAIWGGGWPLEQLWVFIVAPIVGGLLAGFTFRFLLDRTASDSYLEPLELSGESTPKN
jgi:aquaporin Z